MLALNRINKIHNTKLQLESILFQIVDPWGAVIAQCAEKTGIAVAEIDLALLEKVRKNMPCEEHRRTDLYSNMECQKSI